MHWKHRHHEPRYGEILASETEQFLNGSLLDVAFASGDEVPAWIWLSAIAHGDAPLLARTKSWLSDHEGVRPELNGWAAWFSTSRRGCLRQARRWDARRAICSEVS
jgi:hypothetical protein